MLSIAHDQREIVSIIKIVAASSTLNDRLGSKQLRWGRWLYLCACILVLVGTLQSQSSFAQTPHSQAPSCNGPGQVACPAPTPIITPWVYGPDSPFYPTPSNAQFNSIEDINAWFEAKYTNSGWCTMTYQSTTAYPVQSSVYGIATYYNIWTSYLGTEPNTGTPLCGYSFTHGEASTVERSVYCPAPLAVTYQSSPLVGPFCNLPSATPNPLKQIGSCPTCSGVTVKADPVNVSNGNNYQTETDYAGAGANPLKFTRSYNSLTNYLLQFYSSPRPAASAIMGEAWSATYFQFLLPLSVTDGTTTYNAVYAYRPDGRVLTFNEYAGVYSPDGDVADRLIPVTGGGWQYQTADDTIETYNAAGQLLSVATRGQAPVTINYNASSGLGDPPVSVSDAFGHSLQFAYFFDSTGVQRLTSITDPNGKAISYTYDTYGRITAVTYPDSTTRKYGYDTVTNGWLLVTLTDEAGVAYASWTHGSYGSQVLTSQLAGGVAAYSFSYGTNSNGTITSATVTNPLGQSRTYAEQLVSGVNRTTTVSSPCPGCGYYQTRVLDADGNISSRTYLNVNVTN